MKEFDHQMYVGTTLIDGVIVDNSTKKLQFSNLHNWVTKLKCVQSNCNAGVEIRDASEPLNIHRYLVICSLFIIEFKAIYIN